MSVPPDPEADKLQIKDQAGPSSGSPAQEALPGASDEATSAIGEDQRPGGGPHTEAGKKAVSQNATTHAINSLNPVAGGEDPKEWEEFQRGMVEHFAPFGVIERELVHKMAIDLWRGRRVIRHETMVINARRKAVHDRVQPQFSGPTETVQESLLNKVGCDIAKSMVLLGQLNKLKAETTMTPRQLGGVISLLIFCPYAESPELPGESDEVWGCTVGSLRDWATKHASALGMTYDQLVEATLDVAQSTLERQAERQKQREAAEVDRIERERAVILPTPGELEHIIRYEAHLNRSFARTLDQLETLQRIRLGEHVPAPVRLKVTMD